MSDAPPSPPQPPFEEPTERLEVRSITPRVQVPARIKRLILAAVSISTLLAAIGTALSPYLLVRHPLLLLGLSPDVQFLALAAAAADPWSLLVITLPRRLFALAAAYGFGALYGAAVQRWAARRMPRLSRVLRWLEGAQRRHGGLLLLISPSYTVSMLAGAVRTRLPLFFFAVAVGQVVQSLVTLYLGRLFAASTAILLELVSEYVVECTVAAIAVVTTERLWTNRSRLRAAIRRRRGRGERGEPEAHAPLAPLAQEP